MKRITVGISAAVLMLTGAGLAAEENGPALQPETRAEAQARAEHLFDRLDVNHDGKLDQADRAARMGEKSDQIDTNHKQGSRGEYAAAHEHMDADHDADHAGQEHGPAGENHEGGGGHMGHGEHGGMLRLILHRADPAHSGTVTHDAFVQAALSLFDEADANHDGVLTPAERQAYTDTMHQRMHAEWSQHDGAGGDMPPPAH